MNKILFFGALCLLSLAGGAFAVETVYTLGGRDGWPELSVMDGVSFGKGRYGWQSVELATNSRSVDGRTDMLVSFDGETFRDETGNYRVRDNSLLYTGDAIMGSGAGLGMGSGGIVLSGSEGALFSTSGVTGSFLIEFWLCPAIAESGEVVFSWRSSRTIANYPLYQTVRAGFFNSRLRWEFTNVFSGYSKDGGTVALQEFQASIPGEWSHHVISYDEETGLLEYRINGRTEDLVYVTTNGKEHGGSIYTPVLGVPADVEFCPQFTGKIDDIRIQRVSLEDGYAETSYDTYRPSGGRLVSNPICISNGASLTRVDALVSTPSQTDVVLYVRSGDNYFNWTQDFPEWVPVESGDTIDGVTGLYFQLAADLYPDGGGATSPSITQVDLHFTEVPVPLPPFSVTAEGGNGTVTLSWSRSVDESAGGYYVFYGERPGEYLGRDASQGASPIDVGAVTSVTLTGLTNGKMYYFAIASYSKVDRRISGNLSKEVYARPLRRSK